MLTLDQEKRLECLQTKALKTIYGWDKSSGDVLSLSGITSLKSKREEQFKSFAERCSKNQRFSAWFRPSPDTGHDTRSRPTYIEPAFRTERMRNSPVNAMLRALNARN